MKKFTDYLTESTKTYRFRVTVAGDVTSEHAEKLKAAAEKFSVKKMSAPKRLPIQHHHEFPSVGPTEITLIDLELQYPATTEQLENAIKAAGACGGMQFNVKTDIQAANTVPVEPAKKSLLTQEELKAEDAKSLYTDQQIEDLMAEFKKMAMEYGGPKGEKAKTTNDLPQGNKSTLGNTKTTPPDVKSAAR